MFRGIYPSFLFLALGFINITTALVMRDHPFASWLDEPKSIPIESGRFSENCDSFGFDPKTCVFTAYCKPSTNGERHKTKLDLNKCLWYHNIAKNPELDDEGRGWCVQWNAEGKDRQG